MNNYLKDNNISYRADNIFEAYFGGFFSYKSIIYSYSDGTSNSILSIKNESLMKLLNILKSLKNKIILKNLYFNKNKKEIQTSYEKDFINFIKNFIEEKNISEISEDIDEKFIIYVKLSYTILGFKRVINKLKLSFIEHKDDNSIKYLEEYKNLETYASNVLENYNKSIDEINELDDLLQKKFNLIPNINYEFYGYKDGLLYRTITKQDVDNVAVKIFNQNQIQFLRKIFRFLNEDEIRELYKQINERNFKIKNTVAFLSELNLNNSEIQQIFSKNKIKDLNIILSYFPKMQYKDSNIKEYVLPTLLSNSNKKIELLTLLHSNMPTSDKFVRYNDMANLKYQLNLDKEFINNTQSTKHNPKIFPTVDHQKEYYLALEETEKNKLKELETLKHLSSNPNLTNINSNAGEKLFKVLILVKNKDMDKFLNLNKKYIDQIYPNFNRNDFLNKINKIKEFENKKLNLNDTSSIRIIDEVLSFIKSIENSKVYSKYFKVSKPKIKEVNFEFDYGNIKFKTLGYLNPLALEIGKYTDCCQSIGAAGEQAAIDSFINPKSNVVILYDKENNILAQSYFHYVSKEEDPNGPGIILDNVEVSKYAAKIKLEEAFKKFAEDLKTKLQLKYVRCGLGYNKLDSNYFEIGSDNSEDPRHFSVKNPYSDYQQSEFLILA